PPPPPPLPPPAVTNWPDPACGTGTADADGSASGITYAVPMLTGSSATASGGGASTGGRVRSACATYPIVTRPTTTQKAAKVSHSPRGTLMIMATLSRGPNVA